MCSCRTKVNVGLLLVPFCVLLLLTACGGGSSAGASSPAPAVTPQQPTPAPIVTLTPASQSANPGQPVTLSWSATNFSKLTVPVDGDVTNAQGSVTFNAPTSTQTYTATAVGSDGKTTATATATVSINAPPPPANPTITFGASPTTLIAGQSATLTWTTQNAASVTIVCSSQCGSIAGAPSPLPLSDTAGLKVTPTATTTYTLIATNSAGVSVSSQPVVVTVENPVTATLTATASSIMSGNSVSLAWTTSNATSATLSCNPACSPALPSLLPTTENGLTQSPSATTTYKLIATGPDGVTTAASTATVTVNAPTNMSAIGHIVFALQENRSFDHYFGKLNMYRAQHGLPTDVDTLFNTDGSMKAINPNPSYSNGSQGAPIAPFHMKSMCTELQSPFWNESHLNANLNNPTSNTFLNNGFAFVAGKFAQDSGLTDTAGQRAMGYYDWTDLPYYYYLVSAFATSDRMFSPLPTNTAANRMFVYAATSGGRVYRATGPQNVPTIFNLLDNAHVSWTLYAEDISQVGLYGYSSLSSDTNHIAPLSRFATDAASGKLPSVSVIETSADNEHPEAGQQVQQNAAVMIAQINAFMNSPEWKDGAFILTYDEAGGFFDHVPPVYCSNLSSACPFGPVNGVGPQDLTSTDIPGDFSRSGFRLPLMVVSPFAKPHYVSHTIRDYTSILKLIEERFALPSLTDRDANQPDMGEFFDFSAPNLNTPSTSPPPLQPTNGPCTPSQLR